MFKPIIAVAVALLGAPALIVAADAAPAGLGSAKPAITAGATATATQVYWRKKHHHRYYRAHGVGAGVQLYIGEGRRHHRHNKWRRWHKRHH
jgi:hypothetical protein